MKASVIVTCLALGVLASSAYAADLSIKGNIAETVEASDNYFLSSAPSGYTLKSSTAGTLDFLAQTPTTRYLLDTNYSYYKYFGPGAAGTSLNWGTPASATFTIDHTTELTKYNLAASWNRADTTTTQLEQTGTATTRGSINTFGLRGGIVHDLSRTDSLSWNAHVSSVSFTGSSGTTPYVDLTTAVAWNHNLNRTTTLNNSVSFDWFSQDNTAKSQRLLWTVMSGLQSQLSPRLTLNGQFGLVFANSYQLGEVQVIPTPGAPFQPLVGSGHGWEGNVGLTYQLLKDTNVSLTAADVIVPTFTGQLQQTSSIGMSLGHKINQLSNVTFSTQYAETMTPGQIGQTATSSDFFSASVGYAYQLTREWNTILSYTYRDNVTVAKSSTILFTLKRDFTLMGNSGAFNEAEQERARERAKQAVGLVFPAFH